MESCFVTEPPSVISTRNPLGNNHLALVALGIEGKGKEVWPVTKGGRLTGDASRHTEVEIQSKRGLKDTTRPHTYLEALWVGSWPSHLKEAKATASETGKRGAQNIKELRGHQDSMREVCWSKLEDCKNKIELAVSI